MKKPVHSAEIITQNKPTQELHACGRVKNLQTQNILLLAQNVTFPKKTFA